VYITAALLLALPDSMSSSSSSILRACVRGFISLNEGLPSLDDALVYLLNVCITDELLLVGHCLIRCRRRQFYVIP